MRRKSPKTSFESPAKIQIQQVSKPEPKIGFSYKNDPHNTPTRHTTLPRTENISLVQTETPEPKSDTITTVNLNSNDFSRFRKYVFSKIIHFQPNFEKINFKKKCWVATRVLVENQGLPGVGV